MEENIESETPTITVESNLADPDLKEAIKGHEVNGFGLCPPVCLISISKVLNLSTNFLAF